MVNVSVPPSKKLKESNNRLIGPIKKPMPSISPSKIITVPRTIAANGGNTAFNIPSINCTVPPSPLPGPSAADTASIAGINNVPSPEAILVAIANTACSAGTTAFTITGTI